MVVTTLLFAAGFASDVLEHSDALSRHQHFHGLKRVEFADPDVQHQFQSDTDRGPEFEITGQPAGEVGRREGYPQFGRPLRRIPARERLQSRAFQRRAVRGQPEQNARAAHNARMPDIVLYIIRGPQVWTESKTRASHKSHPVFEIFR